MFILTLDIKHYLVKFKYHKHIVWATLTLHGEK